MMKVEIEGTMSDAKPHVSQRLVLGEEQGQG